MLIPKLNSALAYGGDYNPEQWPESVWQEDIKLMKASGVNLVTLGVFSWAKLQPAEEIYDFGWLDRAMNLLGDNGILVDLATATASPPPWMSHHYPDVLAVDANGALLYPGSRQHYSPCSPTYRRLAAALVNRLAARYKNHAALAVWHINNEYGNHVAECHSADTTVAFRHWLKRRHVTLDALNAAWGTAFWSQQYSAWEEILTPRRTPTFANPSQQLDYKRFMSAAVLELFVMERDIVRAATPDVPVTTNYMGFHKPMDYRKWSAEMDFVSWDSYPDPFPGHGGAAAGAAAHDLVRSLKKGRPFLLMEQAISSVTWNPVNGPKPPGLMRLWSWQALARGSDGVLFFQWRAAKAGAEKFLGGMVSHIPAEKSRSYAEVKALGAELKQLASISGTKVEAKVAIVFDWEAWWALEFDSKPSPMAYAVWAQQIHAHFYAENIPVDFVHPAEELGNYRLVIAPALYLLSQTSATNLTGFVEKGGHLLATYFSGIVDENEQVVLGGYPAYLRAVLGLWVEEWLPMAAGATGAIRYARSHQEANCSHWSEIIHVENAEVLATHIDGVAAGHPAITRNTFGRGAAFYLGTKLETAALNPLLVEISRQAGVATLLPVPAGIEVTVRQHENRKILFLLNHRDEPVRFSLHDFSGIELISGQRVGGNLELPPFGTAAINLTPDSKA